MQLSNFQENKPISKKSPITTMYRICWWVGEEISERGVHAKIRNTPNGSPDPEFPNLIDIDGKLPDVQLRLPYISYLSQNSRKSKVLGSKC